MVEHWPSKPETRVRFPSSAPGSVWTVHLRQPQAGEGGAHAQRAPVAQWEEQGPSKAQVAGSSPAGRARGT